MCSMQSKFYSPTYRKSNLLFFIFQSNWQIAIDTEKADGVSQTQRDYVTDRLLAAYTSFKGHLKKLSIEGILIAQCFRMMCCVLPPAGCSVYHGQS